METFTALFSPLGSAYFVAVTLLVSTSLAGLSVGFFGTGLVHRPVAGFAALVGTVSTLWMLYAFGAALATPFEATPTIPLVIVTWLSITLLGGSLFVKGRSASTGIDADDAVSAD